MSTTDKSKRVVSILAKALIGLALLTLAAGLLYPRWARQRDRARALDEFASGLDDATLEFERCVTGTDESSAYGRSMFEQLRTRDFELDYKPALEACAIAYTGQLDRLGNRVDAFPLRDTPQRHLDQPMLGSLCSALELSRKQRDDLLTELDLSREPLPAIDCGTPELEVRTLASNRAAGEDWKVHELRSGELLIADDRRLDRRYARVAGDGAMTWFVPPAQLDPHPFIPLQVAAKRPFVLSFDPQAPSKVMLGSWLGSSSDPEQFDQRRLDIGIPDIVLTSAERWFFVDDRHDSLEIQISDDEGTSFTPVRVPFPQQLEHDRSTSHWGYVEGKRLVLLVVHEPVADDSTEAQKNLLFVVRVDEAGGVSTNSIDYERGHRSIDLYACATPSGAFATIGNHLLIHAGDVPTIVHDFAPATTRTLACQGERAVVVVDDSSGLQRFVCSDQDCGDAALVTRQKQVAVSLRATATGVRAALLTTTGDVDLYIVDEPLGGPLERIDRLARGDQLESGQLDSRDLPFIVEGVLHAGAARAEQFYMKWPTEADPDPR